jgi:hypothetical protein
MKLFDLSLWQIRYYQNVGLFHDIGKVGMLGKSESDILSSILSLQVHRSCENILTVVKSLDKDLHIQHFNQENVSFMVKELTIAEIKLVSGGFVLSLTRTFLIGVTRAFTRRKITSYMHETSQSHMQIAMSEIETI